MRSFSKSIVTWDKEQTKNMMTSLVDISLNFVFANKNGLLEKVNLYPGTISSSLLPVSEHS